ncbi:hypothetical protein GCM10027435_17020 [Haloparvum alkalitolerans]|uniref:McrB family protein n=1 Tax=Haloparvum alkalitolerans TaxID=1042953 RepID=UPI003CF7EBDB
MRSTLLLASLSDSPNVFDDFVRTGLKRRDFPAALPATHGDPVRCLPVPTDAPFDPGDVVDDRVLFDLDGDRYAWVATVTDVRSAPGIASQGSGIASGPWGELEDTVLLLGVPIPVSIDRRGLHDVLDDEPARSLRRLTEAERTTVEDDYGSVERLLLAHREPPDVWIDARPNGVHESLADRAPAASAELVAPDGTEDASIGDVVLHLAGDDHEVVGTSVVSSSTARDADGAVAVSEYRPLRDTIRLFDDVFDDPSYAARLNRIADEHGDFLYDADREPLAEVQFARCPPALLELFIAESSALLDHLKTWYYQVQRPAPADAYNSIEEALVDVRVRSAFSDHGLDWFADETLSTAVSHLAETLPTIQPDGDVTPRDDAYCELFRDLYERTEPRLTTAVSRLGIGAVQPLTEPQTLFFALFRDLQRAADVGEYAKPVNVRAVLEEDYTVTTPRRQTPIRQGQPLATAEKPDQADDIARQLAATGQMVFYGPPGTGKTYTAAQFAKWWLHQQSDIDPTTDQLETVTFHPSFTYEDFIEGLKADNTDDGVVYDYQPGVFKEFVESAREAYRTAIDDTPRYVLIIDEINRGNLAQIFGETITGLEYDKRLDGANETTVSLAHSGQAFTIPPNLYLIGTMNTADRSIALVDAALRRRFRFLAFPPDFEAIVEDSSAPFTSIDALRTAAETPGHANRLFALSILAVIEFNETILATGDLGKGKQIGHSFFFGKTTGPELVDTWRFEILPLLEEYFYGQFDRIRDAIFGGGGQRLIDYDTEEIRSFDAATLTAELATLLDVDE